MTDPAKRAFGIDIGGTGIKGAIVDLGTGELSTDRERIPTPQPSTPDAVAEIVAQIVRDHQWTGPVGATFPAIIKDGVARSAANVDPSWIGVNVDKAFTDASGCQVTVLNDADAAGLGEVRYGAAKGVSGVVLVLTFGTGIGSGLFLDGRLVPNTELGHIEIDGHDAERRAAYSAKERHELSWEKWAERVQHYLAKLEALFTPDLFVVGGGVSKKADKWVPLLDVHAPIRPAQLLNNAGIVGAALAATENRGE
jgi:polyphosphate glucokinase